MPRPRGTARTTRATAPRTVSVEEQTERLAIEAYSVLARALTLYGIPTARQKRLFSKASKGTPKRAPALSETLLEEFYDVGNLLAAWARELPYLDPMGKPKILPIRGRGSTFESLARQFLPERPLEEVVDLACSSINVSKVSGNKIAILGEPMMKLSDNPGASLAQIVSHIANIVSTVESNRTRATRDSGAGRLERVVKYPLSNAQFDTFRRAIRPQLNALTEHADHLLKSLVGYRMRARRATAVGGLGIYLYHREKARLPASTRLRTAPRAARSRGSRT